MGFVAAFELGGEPIGTIRLVPWGLGIATTEKLAAMPREAPARHLAWEVGRLVLKEDCRCGPQLLKRCLFLTLAHLVRTVDIANIFASCNPVLSRLYRRFGFCVIASDACATPEGSYSLIHGTVPRVLLGLAATASEVELAHQLLDQRPSALH